MLSCLELPQQDIFIKTLAASLDLKMIREFRGRAVRALLCKGDGNNGKDSLREAAALLCGVGVINTTVSDFQAYDQGRKLTLAKLEHARIIWSSENSSFGQLDSLQSLKAAITGEPIDLERKNQDERQMSLSTVFFFNINNVPNLQASLEAIQSRWAVLSFNKTFKVNADPAKGEIEADPRFRYDPNFLKMEVVPALLNKMLAALPEVAMKGIDYDCTESALQEIQQETNHLWRFAREVGLGYQVGGRVYINDLWEMLKQWYLTNGTLVVTTSTDGKKEKYEWHDQPFRGDKNVKAPNQIFQRFSELFPKVRRERDNSNLDRKGQFYLSGLGFGGSGEVLQGLPEEESIANRIIDLFQKLSPDEQQTVKNALNSENKDTDLLHQGSLPCQDGAIASPTASPTAPTASPSFPTIEISEPEISNNNSPGSVATASATHFTIDNSKNFDADSKLPDFKVGDRVLIHRPRSKYHGKIGEFVRFNWWKEGYRATVQFPDEIRPVEMEIACLRLAPPLDEL